MDRRIHNEDMAKGGRERDKKKKKNGGITRINSSKSVGQDRRAKDDG